MARRRSQPVPPPPSEPGVDMAPLPCLAMTVEEAAEVLRLSRCTVLDLIGEGRLRVVRVGRRIIIPAKAIEAFLNPDCESG